MLSEHLNIGDFNGRIYMAKHGGTIDSSLDYSLVKGGGSEKGDREAATGPLYLKIVVSKTSAGQSQPRIGMRCMHTAPRL